MKIYNYTLALVLLSTFKVFSQIPITNTVAVGSQTFLGSAPGTYIKDINGVYNPYIGNWSWTNGAEKITFTFKKITQYYYAKHLIYGDFLVADYKYTNSDGVVVIDTSSMTVGSNNIKDYKMFSVGFLMGELPFRFTDVILSKNANIIFTLINGNVNQMHYKLENFGQTVVEGTPFVTEDFSIPDDKTVIKE